MKAVKRRRKILVIAVVAFICFLTPVNYCMASGASEDVGRVSISKLIDDMDKYDGHTVTVTGEVIGDVMVRGNYAWITVNDDPYSKRSLESGAEFTGVSNIGIGVWIPSGDAGLITYIGGYSKEGDTVEVRGVFHRACKQHGGDTDIHADSLKVVRNGHDIIHPFSWSKFMTVLLLACIFLLMLYIWIKREKSTKRGMN
ncbi:MAG: hypothetical protein JW738_06800 [Actinobacteria bacterium]|nr:hypothetical protein [Actinomycetota bacterium]